MPYYYAQYSLPELNEASTPCEQIWYHFVLFMKNEFQRCPVIG
jgi:hypothetical protein